MAGTPSGAAQARAPGPEDDTPPETTARVGGGGTGATIEGDTGPILRKPDQPPETGGGGGRPAAAEIPPAQGAAGFRGEPARRHAGRAPQPRLRDGDDLATNLLVLAIPIYLFQISDRVLTSRSLDTLVMLTVIIVGAVLLQALFDAMRRFILMRTAVEVAVRLGAPILSAAAHASLHGTGREYQTLGDLQQLRGFLTSGTLLSFLDVPFAPLFVLAIFLVHPHLG